MPDDEGPRPSSGCAPPATVVGGTMLRVVRRMLARAVKPGVVAYNDVLASHGLAPIPLDGFPQAPMASARRVFLNGSPGLEFPGSGRRPMPSSSGAGAGPRGRRTRTPCRHRSSTRGASCPRVAGAVDNTDPAKLIVPTLEALADGP